MASLCSSLPEESHAWAVVSRAQFFAAVWRRLKFAEVAEMGSYPIFLAGTGEDWNPRVSQMKTG